MSVDCYPRVVRICGGASRRHDRGGRPCYPETRLSQFERQLAALWPPMTESPMGVRAERARRAVRGRIPDLRDAGRRQADRR